MGLNIIEWFRNFGKKPPKSVRIAMSITDLAEEINIREAAFHACINLIANTVSNCELRVYRDYECVKDDLWYTLNREPNINQNASAFWQKLVRKLYENNEALIIKTDKEELYVADTFIRQLPANAETAFYPYEYSGIMIDGQQYSPTLSESSGKAFYFKLHDEPVKVLVEQITNLYAQVLSSFISNYTGAQGDKGILHIDRQAQRADGFEEDLEIMINQDFKKFYESKNAVIPLYEGYQYESLAHDLGPAGDTRDLRNQIQDVFEITAMAFGIPKHLITGDVQDTSKAIESLLTFAIDPLLKTISEELNRKLFSRTENTSGGCYVRWKSNTIKHMEILEIAANVEKLIGSGALTINEVREATGYDALKEEFANKSYMTKNFSTADKILDSVERRETDETGNDSQT